MDESKLIQSIQKGDIEAYRHIVEKYQSPLLRYVVSLIRDTDLAEDAVQETFIKAYKNLQSFDRKKQFSSWIYRIAHNSAMDAVKRNRSVPFDDAILAEPALRVEPTIAEEIDAEITSNQVSECLYELPLKYREPLVLYFLQQKSYQEIADVLRASTTSIGVRITRAKQKLRAICKRKGVTP